MTLKEAADKIRQTEARTVPATGRKVFLEIKNADGSWSKLFEQEMAPEIAADIMRQADNKVILG